jgi:aspartokinase
MHLDTYTVGKFGGGVLNSPESIKSLPEVLSRDRCNVIVVSAFHGQTRLLGAICDAVKNDDHELFYGEFMAFHKYIAQELNISNEMESFFKEKLICGEEKLAHLFFADHSSRTGQAARAGMLALGEDFSSMIVATYLKKFYDYLWRIVKVDAREIFVTTSNSPIIGASLNMSATKKEIAQRFNKKPNNKIYVVQGFVCGIRRHNITTPKTAVLPFDGSDTSAAVLASFIPVPRGHRKAKLVYYKQPTNASASPLPSAMYFDELTEFMNRTGSVVVSPDVGNVPEMPRQFIIKRFDGFGVDTAVVMKRVTPIDTLASLPLELASRAY